MPAFHPMRGCSTTATGAAAAACMQATAAGAAAGAHQQPQRRHRFTPASPPCLSAAQRTKRGGRRRWPRPPSSRCVPCAHLSARFCEGVEEGTGAFSVLRARNFRVAGSVCIQVCPRRQPLAPRRCPVSMMPCGPPSATPPPAAPTPPSPSPGSPSRPSCWSEAGGLAARCRAARCGCRPARGGHRDHAVPRACPPLRTSRTVPAVPFLSRGLPALLTQVSAAQCCGCDSFSLPYFTLAFILSRCLLVGLGRCGPLNAMLFVCAFY